MSSIIHTLHPSRDVGGGVGGRTETSASVSQSCAWYASSSSTTLSPPICRTRSSIVLDIASSVSTPESACTVVDDTAACACRRSIRTIAGTPTRSSIILLILQSRIRTSKRTLVWSRDGHRGPAGKVVGPISTHVDGRKNSQCRPNHLRTLTATSAHRAQIRAQRLPTRKAYLCPALRTVAA